ncbi:hypothetical protein V8C42DRAFT_232442 [Trichoderma barbatum]
MLAGGRPSFASLRSPRGFIRNGALAGVVAAAAAASAAEPAASRLKPTRTPNFLDNSRCSACQGGRAEFGAHRNRAKGSPDKIKTEEERERERERERNKGPVRKGRASFVLELRFAYDYPGSVRDLCMQRGSSVCCVVPLSLFSWCPKKNKKLTRAANSTAALLTARVGVLCLRQRNFLNNLPSWLSVNVAYTEYLHLVFPPRRRIFAASSLGRRGTVI